MHVHIQDYTYIITGEGIHGHKWLMFVHDGKPIIVLRHLLAVTFEHREEFTHRALINRPMLSYRTVAMIERRRSEQRVPSCINVT